MATTRPALLRRMSFHYSDVQLADVITAMKDPITGIKLKDKRYFLKAYAKCFTGVDAVNWIAEHLKISRKDAEKLGQILLTRHYIHHISYKHHFEDKYIFFKFNEGQYQPDALEAPFHKFPDLLRNGEVDFVVLFKMMIDEENGVEVRPRKKGLKSYSNCFVGSELVSWLSATFQLSRNISVDIGAKFMADGYISHVTESYPFADDHFFYRFNYEMALTKSNRRRLSIGLALASFWLQSDGKPFKESLMDISYRIGTKSVNTKAYIILENDGLNIFETSSKTKNIAKILLQNIVRIHRSVVRNSFTITTQLQQKLMIFNSNPEILGDWQLAVDAFKYPNHFSGSCMDISDKTQLLRSLFYDGYKGGLIKSSDDEEWTYTNGLLSMADNIRKSLVIAYKWDGQILSNANDADHEEVGRWDGVRIAWMDGTHEEPDSSLAYIFHEGEYQNQDPTLNWKISRHFLVSVSDGNMFWAVNGSVPPPVVMFLQLMRTKKQMVAHFNSVMSSVSVTVSESIPTPSPIIETV